MKIIVVTFNDSDNLAIQNVLVELGKRGHQMTIFAPFQDSNSLRMLRCNAIPIRKFEELTDDIVKQYDVAFCSNMMIERMKMFEIYCFVYTSFLDNSFVTDGGDFLFTARKRHLIDQLEYNCATMPVGIPKNDRGQKKICENNTNKILFIDSGHIPFGMKGKRQIADTLLSICNNFPTYEICIKPRWLKEKGIHYTHHNAVHLYDVIEERCNGNIPDNLNMLQEHIDLQELIDNSLSVITLYSSAHLDAVLRGKGILILTGWDNEDKYDLRNDIILKRQIQLYSESGCVVDFREVLNYLPNGIVANELYVKKMVPYISGASKRITDVMEYVYEYFLRRNEFPKRREYDYETYQKEMVADDSINMRELIRERIIDSLICQGHSLKNRIIGKVDFSGYYIYLRETINKYELSKKSINEYIDDCKYMKNQILVCQEDLLMNDSIDQSILFRVWYELKMYNRFFELELEQILCIGPYYYYLGMIYENVNNADKATVYFLKYIHERNKRSFEKYPQDEVYTYVHVCKYIFSHITNTIINNRDFVDLCLDFFENGHIQLLLLEERKKIIALLPSVANCVKDIDLEKAFLCIELYAKWSNNFDRDFDGCSIIEKLQGENERVYKSISYKIGRLITWLPRKLRRLIYLREVLMNQKEKVRQSHPIQIYKIFCKKVFHGYELYSRVIKKYGCNAEMYLSALAIGDSYICAGLLGAYLEKRKDCNRDLSCPILCTFGNGGNEAVKLVGNFPSEPFDMEETKHLYNLLMFLPPELIHLCSMHYHVFYRHTGILSYLLGIHGTNLLSMYKAYLNVETANIMLLPVKEDIKYLDKVFSENQLIPGRTVLLSPYAKSVKILPETFWIKLAIRLKAIGAVVCTNSVNTDKEPAIKGTGAVSIPFSQCISFLKRAGITIGLRSGFQDVTSMADCLKISIHPTDTWKLTKVADMDKVFRLTDMYGQSNQYDYSYYMNEEDDLIDIIVTKVDEYINNKEVSGRT